MGKKSRAAGTLLQCHKCSKLVHTANKCRNSEKVPHTRAREVNEFIQVTEVTEVMSSVDVMVTSLGIADRDGCVESAV